MLPISETLSVHRMLHIRNLHRVIGLLSLGVGEMGLLLMAETLSAHLMLHIRNLHGLIGLLSFRGEGAAANG
jgi:hypothetical protein